MVCACLVFCLAGTSLAQSPTWRGTYTVRGPGVNLSGSWTASLHQDPYAGWGTWTLFDGSGRAAGSGSWSARKTEKAWEGRWQVRVADQRGSISGTWTANLRINGAARFADLLQSALNEIVSGTWGRSSVQNGTWSIRAAPGDQP
ncbi:MAG: hypothetical protein HY236_06440 [Acidobacteria bacterium]|nr:hypothetical protein [Acidobacteriota bacterium]